MDNRKQNKYIPEIPEKTDILRDTLESLIFTTTITIIFILLSELAVKTYARRSACAYMENAIFLQHFVDGVIEDLLDLTDSEDSSSSSNTGVFESHQPYVLELHDLVKDDPASQPQPENPAPDAKVKKHRKKKGPPGANQTAASDTSSSVSESSVPPTGLEEHSREEFYDAHESYHGLTENQAAANPVVAAGLVQARSEHAATPKPTAEQTALQPTLGSASRREPSTTVTKPTTNPQ